VAGEARSCLRITCDRRSLLRAVVGLGTAASKSASPRGFDRVEQPGGLVVQAADGVSPRRAIISRRHDPANGHSVNGA
jgi:hypothetical protein